ncbi:hypothetical protein ASL83_003262 [Vibrio parahaemolyticus]|nr:hypothetical protein [Vibrio parahaemolyticus]
MSEYTIIAFITGLLALVWFFRPRGNSSKSIVGEQRDSIIQICKDDPCIIEYVSLLDTFGKEVVCELKLKDREPIRVDSGVNATGTWLRLKALKNGSELPEYLLHNE